MKPADTSPEFDAKAFLSHASSRPGVYRMFDAQGQLLYVGKAKNLKKRLASYFRASGLDSKTLSLVSHIDSIETTITNTETEALLLEQNLIKDNRPPYNILLRDDKSYPFIFLSTEDEYPRLTLHRGTKRQKGRYFGPYPGATAVRESLQILQKVFKVRQCEDSYFANRTRPCLQYQIKRCSGPCVGLVSPQDYDRDVRHSMMFLEGKSQLITEELSTKMEACAEQLDFETASLLRDQIRDLRVVQEKQYVYGEKGDVDVIAMKTEAGIVCIQVVFIRAGRVIGNKNYYPKFVMENTPSDILYAFIAQFYLRESRQHSIPSELICSASPSEKDTLEEALKYLSQRVIQIKHAVRGHRQKWLQLAITNAEHGLLTRLNSRQSMEQRFFALQEVLALEKPPARLECFDISHSSGEATVASCVVFDHNGPVKADYRRFNIEGITAGDDYAAMQQALKRRFTRLKKGEGKKPDILLVDGGKGQLTQAEEVLTELALDDILLIGIAKGISRRAGEETLITGFTREEIALEVESSALHLLQQIRDESHRFAINAHRQKRGKKRISSFLDDIPGIGPKKRRELIRYFGGQQEIKKASVDELKRVEGINDSLANEIYSYIHTQ